MAAPEIGLQLAWEDLEKSQVKKNDHTINKAELLPEVPPTSSTRLDSPLVYRYLSFETELPSFEAQELPIDANTTLPEPPDLRELISPFTWSESRKSFIAWLSSAVTVVTAYSAGAYAPAAPQLSRLWGVGLVPVYLGVTMYTTGFSIAPMVLAPFSEINGRYPVFVATGIVLVIGQVGCAVTQSYAGMLVSRFILGVGGSTFSTMVGGVVSDIYRQENRNKAMAVFSGLLAPVVWPPPSSPFSFR